MQARVECSYICQDHAKKCHHRVSDHDDLLLVTHLNNRWLLSRQRETDDTTRGHGAVTVAQPSSPGHLEDSTLDAEDASSERMSVRDLFSCEILQSSNISFPGHSR